MTAVSARDLGVAVGLVVLGAVFLTARSITVPVTRPSLNVAGFASGLVGTTSAIGGPPMALLYQHRPAAEIRSTMAVFFLVGTTLSLSGLAVTGNLSVEQLTAAGLLLPALIVGDLVGGWARGRVAGDRIRALVLAVSAASALVLIVRSVA